MSRAARGDSGNSSIVTTGVRITPTVAGHITTRLRRTLIYDDKSHDYFKGCEENSAIIKFELGGKHGAVKIDALRVCGAAAAAAVNRTEIR